MFKNELIKSCANGESFKVNEILKDKKINVNDYAPSNGNTAIQYAATNGYIDIVKALVNAGARYDQHDNSVRTTLFKACQSGQSPELVEYLIEIGSLINRQDKFQATPLFAVCESLCESIDNSVNGITVSNSSNHVQFTNKLKIVQILLNKGANSSIVNSSGKTPLMMASKSLIPELVQLLINANSDPSLKDHLGLSSFDYANGDSQILKILNKELVYQTPTNNTTTSTTKTTTNSKCSSCKNDKSTSKYCSFCGHKF